MDKKRVLVGSTIYQKPKILEAFLKSLKNLSRNTVSIDYMFVDDNIDEKSSQLLAAFEREESNVINIPSKDLGLYKHNDESKHADDSIMIKVINYKNSIINYAIENTYDYLFFVDSDLVLHPNLVEHLKIADKDIVCEIFWSQRQDEKSSEPNVWMFDKYDLLPKRLSEELTEKEMQIQQTNFLNQLRIPGLYEVGGLGACTLINRDALVKDVSFRPIKNLTAHGADRFFCIRASVLGIDLFVDTHYPAYHINNEQDLDGVQDYINNCKMDLSTVRQYKVEGNKITLSMIVKNEEGRYLKQVLKSLKWHIDEAVIIDDGSSDNTVGMCKEILKGIPLHIIQDEKSIFSSEVELRRKQWCKTIETNPDWILNFDADEMLEEDFWYNAQKLINNQNYDIYYFRSYDMWNKNQYREDKYWNSQSVYKPFLIRYQPNLKYIWNETLQHGERFPIDISSFSKATSEFRVKHFGWSTEEDRAEKYKRYQILVPDVRSEIKEKYASIMDTEPNLIKWVEE